MTAKEPTSKDLADACRDVLPQVICDELASMSINDALGYAFTLLIEIGVDDPEAFLAEKGILV